MTQLTINTSQNVNISFEAATVGTRIVSFAIDAIIQVSYIILVSLLLTDVFQISSRGLDRWSEIAIFLVFMSPAMFYSLVQESVFEGQTVGKRLTKIKVVKLDGYQASFGDYLIRWMFRLVDVFTNSGAIALIAIISSSKSQRLGDMAAGTAVISLETKVGINSTILQELEEEYVPLYPQVIKLSDNDVRIIKETMEMSLKARNAVVMEKLASKITSVTGIVYEGNDIYGFIRTILKDYNYYTQNM